MTELLQKLIEYIEQASPELWRILTKQVYLDAGTNLVWAVFLIALSVWLYKKGFYWWGKYKEEGSFSDYDTPAVVAWLVAAFGIGIAAALFTMSARLFINPEYYAITIILQTLGR